MSTNKLVLKSVDQFMADYVPTYQPIYPLFLGKSQQYAEEVGQGILIVKVIYWNIIDAETLYRDWETDRKSTRLNSSHSGESRMPSSA